MNPSKKNAFTPYRAIHVAAQWLSFLLPLVVVLGGALGLFREAVVRSIVSAQHPELVYLILGALLVGVLMTVATMVRYTVEGNLLHRWMHTQDAPMSEQLQGRLAASCLQPLYAVLHAKRSAHAAVQQQLIEREVSSIQVRLQERLTLPQFLAGAMVGLGLVGTFVGLLGTLEDLGKIFSVAPAASGSANASPVALFAGMMANLQAPMRGMGTAFVASLFGLLGSLVLGLQILLANKVGHSLTEQMQSLVRQVSQDKSDDELLPAVVHATPIQINLDEAVQPILDIVKATQSLQVEQFQSWQAWVQEMQQLQRNQLQEQQSLRREVLGLVEVSNTLASAVGQSVSADERYRSSVPRTTYWQDAWVKVQAYLQRSNTDDRLAQLTEASKAQVHALAEMTKTLASIEHRLRVTQAPNDLPSR